MLERNLTELPRVASSRMNDGHTLERRSGRRRAVVMPVQIRSSRQALDGSIQYQRMVARTTNVSDGGMLLTADRPVRPRTRCAINLRDPSTGKRTRALVGRVRWCRFDFSTWMIAVEIEEARSLAA